MHTRSNSLFVRLTSFMTLLVCGQSILLASVLLAAGLLSHTRDNAIQSFHQQVTIRKNYLQAEIRNRWMNIAPFESQIAHALPLLPADRALTPQEYADFFQGITPLLITLLQSSLTTGAFVVLDAPHTYDFATSASVAKDETPLPALYLRDYDPWSNTPLDHDLFMVLGPADLASQLKIPLDTAWHSLLPPLQAASDIDGAKPSRSFYKAPRALATSGSTPSMLGFWSEPLRITPHDIPVMTYSMPLIDHNGIVRGVMGVEISMAYLSQFLESGKEQSTQLQYLLAMRENFSTSSSVQDKTKPNTTDQILQLRITASSQGNSIVAGEKIELMPDKNSKFPYTHISQGSTYIVSAEPLPFYTYNTPFNTEQWYFIGMEETQSLMAFVDLLREVLTLSVIASLILGVTCGMLGSWHFTQPVTRLAKAVRTCDANPSTESTGLAEIDDLATALADAYQKRQESTVTMSRIIELVDEPIGAFELSAQSPHVLATDQLGRILSLNEVEANTLFHDKTHFLHMLDALMSRPEPEERHVYKVTESPAKWVRLNIRTTESSTLGVVMDVSQEIHAKLKMRFDRDYDALTRLQNHASFQKKVTLLLPQCTTLHAALIMFDLDNLKPINDNYGHGWGDIYIKTAAQLLSGFSTNFSTASVSQHIGDPRVLVGRRSGDEFVVFLHSFDSREQILSLVENFYTMLNAYTLEFPNSERKHISISGGLAWVESPTVPYDELLQCADFTLYSAKRNMKGHFSVADDIG